jgi:plasminogen activator
MKRNAIVAVFFIVAVVATLPAQGNFTASLGVDTGFIIGQAEEIVYLDNRSNTYLSQLLWDMKPIFYVGGNADLGWQFDNSPWGVFAHGAGKFGIPGKTGIMEDRDWTDARYSDFLTYYSVSDNKTKKAILADARVGATLYIMDNFTLKLYLSYSFMDFSWSATGGSLLYPENDGGHKYFIAPIEVIAYTQTWHTIAPGVSFGGFFNDYFSAEVALSAAPFIWCTSVDDHVQRSPPLRVTDKVFGGFSIEPSFVFRYTPIPKFTLSLNVAYKYIANPRGDSVSNYPNYTTANRAGVGYNAFDVGISAVYRFF